MIRQSIFLADLILSIVSLVIELQGAQQPAKAPPPEIQEAVSLDERPSGVAVSETGAASEPQSSRRESASIDDRCRGPAVPCHSPCPSSWR